MASGNSEGFVHTAVPLNSAILGNPIIPDMSKVDPFDGKNYKMWSDKMDFFLGQIGVNYTLFVDSTPADYDYYSLLDI